MSAVWRASRAAVKRRRLQTYVIGLVVLFSTATVVLGLTLLVAADGPFDQAFDQQHGAHAVAAFDPARVSAAELGVKGIRVNAVAPGPIETPRMLRLTRGDQLTQSKQSRVPLGRLGRPDEVASVVAFLASDEASYITGIALPVDGGGTAALHQPVVD